MTMPDDGITREQIHLRRIELRGFKRSDGLFEIVGRVTDEKPHDFRSASGNKVVPANTPLHDISVRLIIDIDMVVQEVSASTASAPYGDCFSAAPTLACLKGLKIAAGWRSEVRRLLGGAQSCTHMLELLVPMATAAYQALTVERAGRPEVLNKEGLPIKLDSCYAYANHRQIAKERWPEHYTGKTD